MAETWRECIGDYRLVREIGRGAFGMVYEAIQISLNRRVALKVLPATLFPNPQVVERFRREAMAAAGLSHPNIVTVYEAGRDGDFYYFSMKYVPGRSLAQEIARRGGAQVPSELDDTDFVDSLQAVQAVLEPEKLPPQPDGQSDAAPSGLPTREECSDIAAKVLGVAEALSYAHTKGVIHQDVKPSNLVLDEEGRLCLLDFGTAQIRRLRDDPALSGGVATPLYASPEQLGIEKVPVGPQTDVWSLGGTLYEWVTLSPPFPASDYASLVNQIARADPIPPGEINSEIPRDLTAIIAKALARSLQERYLSAEAFAEDLRRFVRSEPALAAPGGPIHRIVLWKRRNPALAKAVGALAVVLVLSFGGLLYTLLSAETPLERASRLVANKAYAAALPLLKGIGADDPAWAQSLRLQAECFHKLKRFDDLVRLYRGVPPEKAALFKPGELLVGQGKALDDLGRYSEAEAMLRRAAAEAPQRPETHYELGKFLLEQAEREGDRAKHEEAVAGIRQAIQLDGNLAKAHFLLGECLAEEGRLREAEEHIRKAVALRGEEKPKYYEGLAELYLREGKLQEALSAARTAVAVCEGLQPKDVARYRRLQARVLLAQRKQKEAITLLKEVAVALRNDPETIYLLAKAYNLSGKNRKAQEVVQEYFNPEGDLWRARAWALLGKAKEALKFLRVPDGQKEAAQLLELLDSEDFTPIREDARFARFSKEVRAKARL